jgi:hypothetical protein
MNHPALEKPGRTDVCALPSGTSVPHVVVTFCDQCQSPSGLVINQRLEPV